MWPASRCIKSLITSFGIRAHKHFEIENNKHQNRVSGDYELEVEPFRDAAGDVLPRRQSGSIGTDLLVKDKNGSIVENYDLKTYTKSPRKIGERRQQQIEDRIGRRAKEIYEKQ